MVRFTVGLFSVAAGQDLFLSPSKSDIDVLGPYHACVNGCRTTDDKRFKNCQDDGQTDCSKGKCCKVVTDTCYVKNAYWSSCQPSCTKGQKDKMGDTWDCTQLSPSSCSHLQACVKGCHTKLLDNATLVSKELLGADDKCTGGSKTKCYASCETLTIEYSKHLCHVLCDKYCPTDAEKVCPNKKGLGACLSSCKKKSKAPQHDGKCEKDGATSCLRSKCCQSPADKCFTKNKYWAACTGECIAGKPSKSDGQVWDCKEIKAKTVCDPAQYRTCVDDCAENC